MIRSYVSSYVSDWEAAYSKSYMFTLYAAPSPIDEGRAVCLRLDEAPSLTVISRVLPISGL
jgi:hypothetical protein